MHPRTGKIGNIPAVLAVPAIVGLTLLVAACSSAATDVSPHQVVARSVAPSERLHQVDHTSTTAPSVAYPAVTGKVEIYLRAPATSIPSDGRAFVVSVVLVNGLGRSFPVPGSCRGWLAAGLASPAIPFEPAYSAVGCPDDTIHPGTTRLTRTVDTTYQSCSQDPHATVTAQTPACLGTGHDRMPNLPAGRYRLKLDTTSIPHPVVSNPVTVTLTKP